MGFNEITQNGKIAGMPMFFGCEWISVLTNNGFFLQILSQGVITLFKLHISEWDLWTLYQIYWFNIYRIPKVNREITKISLYFRGL